MLRNIGGPHVQRINDNVWKNLASRRLGALKILNTANDRDYVRNFVEHNPEAPVACRLVDDNTDFSNMLERTQQAAELFRPILNIVGKDNCWLEILPNEKYQAGDELGLLAENTMRGAELVSNLGYRPIGFNFSVGNPSNISELNLIYPACDSLNYYQGAVGYHNYSIPSHWLDTWLDLRHVRMKEYLPPGTKFWLNEGFIDHGIIDGRLAGWRDSVFNLDVYAAQRLLRLQAQALAKDLSVVGWTPFGAGCFDDWYNKGFEYADEPLLCSVFSELYEIEGGMEYRIGEGFRRMIAYIGQPLEHETYHFPGTPMETSVAVFENGVAQWYKVTNETMAQRGDGAIFTDRGNHGDGRTVWKVYEPGT